jgi:hypothetical protein
MLAADHSANRAWPNHAARVGLSTALVALALICAIGVPRTDAAPGPMLIVHAPGKIVPIPASVPHEAGDMVDRRIIPDLRWIAARYPIYITDGYSGPLPNGEHVGCDGCHVAGSDHDVGLAVDIVPLGGDARCDASWDPITRLALWAEPRQNEPVAPFRWVGYNGDAGHGCGNHLHLSWNHAPAASYTLAEWVETFPTGEADPAGKPRRAPTPKPLPAPGPRGGISVFQGGGVSPQGD